MVASTWRRVLQAARLPLKMIDLTFDCCRAGLQGVVGGIEKYKLIFAYADTLVLDFCTYKYWAPQNNL